MCVLISCEGGGQQLLNLRADFHSSPSGSTVDEAGRWAAIRLAEHCSAPLIENRFATSLIDVRRSLHHRQLFGSDAQGLRSGQKQSLIDQIYLPYRQQLQQKIAAMMTQHSYLVHLSIRSFEAKTRKGNYRRTDVGLLYDPSRESEVDWCLNWIDQMYDDAPNLRVRRNYPGRGTSDSLTRSMRAEWNPSAYLGIEVWINQSWAHRPSSSREEAIMGMAWALQALTRDRAANAA